MLIIKKIIGIIFILLGGFVLLLNFVARDPVVGLTVAGLLLIAAGVLLIINHKKADTPIITKDDAVQNVVATNEPSAETAPLSANVPPEAVAVNTDNLIKYSFNVAGISYRERDFSNLLYENIFYDMTKKELIEEGLIDEKIFKYGGGIYKVDLVPDPDNEYDANAIKVLANGVHIGFVPSKNAVRVKNIMESKNPSVSWEVLGGPYKILYEDYDYDRDREVYTLEREHLNLGLKITLLYERKK